MRGGVSTEAAPDDEGGARHRQCGHVCPFGLAKGKGKRMLSYHKHQGLKLLTLVGVTLRFVHIVVENSMRRPRSMDELPPHQILSAGSIPRCGEVGRLPCPRHPVEFMIAILQMLEHAPNGQGAERVHERSNSWAEDLTSRTRIGGRAFKGVKRADATVGTAASAVCLPTLGLARVRRSGAGLQPKNMHNSPVRSAGIRRLCVGG